MSNKLSWEAVQHLLDSSSCKAWQYLCGGMGCGECEAWDAGSVINMLQTWQSDLNLWEIKMRKMAMTPWGTRTHDLANGCHVPANWAVKSFSNSVAEFKYLGLSCQGSSRSRYCTDLACWMGRVRRAQSARHRLSYKHASDLTVRDRALYIYLHFYIIPTLFAYFLERHPYILLHF